MTHDPSIPADATEEKPDLANAQINRFRDSFDSTPVEILTVAQALERICADTYQAAIARLRHILEQRGKPAYDKEKAKLPAFTFAGQFAPSRAIANLQKHTGIVHGDLDHLDDVPATKEKICADSRTVYAFDSPSGTGLKIGVCGPVVADDAAYKRAWRLVSAHYERRYGGVWDASGKDISRLCFVSYDTNAYVNFNAEMFVMDSQQWYVEQAIKTAVQMITFAATGTRHHTRLRASRLLGGYVGGNLLAPDEAYAILAQALAGHTDDLERALKTVDDGLRYGQDHPVTIEALEEDRQIWLDTHARNGQRHISDETGQTSHETAGHLDTTNHEGDAHTSPLPVINAADQDIPRMPDTAWKALQAHNTPSRLFMHGHQPIRYEIDAHEQTPIIVDLTPTRLRHELSRAAKWIVYPKPTKDIPKPLPRAALPPFWLVEDMLARPDMPLPYLVRITEIPVFASDETLITTPGYHQGSRLLYVPAAGLSIPEIPATITVHHLAQVQQLLNELLYDFPFASTADRTNAIGLFLLPYVRDLITGHTPLHLIESPGPGSGKGLLADTLMRPAVGKHLGIITEAGSEDEWKKRLTTEFKMARMALRIDNLRKPLDSAQVSAALTTSVWEDRILRTQDAIILPVRCVWIATGNNPVLSEEMARRCIRIRLDPKQDRPWLREGFKIANLPLWVSTHRPQLIWSALVMVRHWLTQGRPKPTTKPLGSYEEWSTIVGGILETSGFQDFLGNLDEFYEITDHDGALWRAFTQLWWERFKDQEVGVNDLYPLAVEMDGFHLGRRDDERSQKTVFGRALGKQRDRVIGTYRIVRAGKVHKLTRWQLLSTEPHP